MSSTGIDDAPRRSTSSEQASISPSHRIETSAKRVPASSHSNTEAGILDSDPKFPSVSAVAPASSFTTKALRFFATATPVTLASIGVGLSAATYAIFGRLGLVLIGAFGGVVSFIIWESKNPELAKAVHGEDGQQVVDRLWADLKTIKRQEGDDTAEDDEQNAIRSFDDFQPETREALGGLVDAVIRDYVKWWYSPIIPMDNAFPLACRKALTSYLLAISNRISRKRPADAFLDLLTNSSSMIIAFLSELAAAFGELPPDSNLTAVDAVYNYLAENPDSRLANLLNRRQQATKIKMVAEDLLGFLDKNSYNCDPARIFLREILANSVLEKTLQQCSKAEWINGWIVYLLEAGEPNLNQAIDVGMQTDRDVGPNVFADLDGNIGNISIAKPRLGGAEHSQCRRIVHKKKLSKADEELEESMEEMKRMNAMIAHQGAKCERAPTVTKASERSRQSIDLISRDAETHRTSGTPGEASPSSDTDKTSLGRPSADGSSTESDTVYSPHTPRSTNDSFSQGSSPQQAGEHHFTSFDQIVPPSQADSGEDDGPKREPLTLHNASFTLHDDSSSDMNKIRSKPTNDYLIQVEPSSSGHPGWMIVRRYADFGTLHEILRRIAAISGATAFTELHKELPSWKIHTKESLRGELERYLRDACWYQSLAESEGMKRFLEKSQGHTYTNSKSFGWEAVGKNMLDVLSIGPKGAVESGRSLVGGVSGVFGNISGLSRRPTTQSVDLTSSASRLSLSATSRSEGVVRSPARSDRASLDSQTSSIIATQPSRVAPMERRPSQSRGDGENEMRMGRGDRMDSVSGPVSARPSMEHLRHSRSSSLVPLRSPSSISLDMTKLPPPPDEITDDYEFSTNGGETESGIRETIIADSSRNSSTHALGSSGPTPATKSGKKGAPRPTRQYPQLTEPETRVAVELIFAVINEMYTLSSAWNIRRTLLAAAKSFLLRPGNPSLLTVQSLIQSSVLDANTADAGIAAQLRKLRENAMPTEQELAAWPTEMTAEEKKKLAAKTRKLLIQSGVPAALMGVMGQSATGEALGRVFDCLQIEEVARGLLFGLILQAVRVLMH